MTGSFNNIHKGGNMFRKLGSSKLKDDALFIHELSELILLRELAVTVVESRKLAFVIARGIEEGKIFFAPLELTEQLMSPAVSTTGRPIFWIRRMLDVVEDLFDTPHVANYSNIVNNQFTHESVIQIRRLG